MHQIPFEFTPFDAHGENDKEGMITVSGMTDPVVVSCDLINLHIPEVGSLTLVIDADFRRDHPEVAGPLQALFDTVEDKESTR